MVETLWLRVITPEGVHLRAEGVQIVEAWLTDGAIGILPRHAPLVAALAPGELVYEDEGGRHTLTLAAGILRVAEGGITVLTTKVTPAPLTPQSWGERGEGRDP
ncbi:MAG: F0F1 ATP synthase subunit epsilon [Chloroflexi bacterium]|nr:F0F1 ATP synthase subunit epsilon [Chloroflexota bacterium]